ncbi:MAG: hypothetical protein H0X37_02335 [Herpetosiphonaceae bacterium]|nr:hypothetical protein [Herpetosiphonaceae bacterium]
MPHQIVLPFEDASGWGAPFPSGKPPITASTNQVHSGQSSEAITYQFATPTNEYVAFERSTPTPTPIPANTTKLGLWIYGDGSGHILQLQLTDAENETLQYRLGFIGQPGWQFLQTSITGPVEDGNRITKGGNGQLDGAVRIKALVVAPHPDTATGMGTIYVDDLTAFEGTEVYASRFRASDGNGVWSPAGSTVQLPSASTTATITERDGATHTITAQNGMLSLNAGAAPIYVHYEINNPATSQVSNGLLVVEMISGHIQVSDTAFVTAAPAAQAVAGDPAESNPDAPTYAAFQRVAYPLSHDPAPNHVAASRPVSYTNGYTKG